MRPPFHRRLTVGELLALGVVLWLLSLIACPMAPPEVSSGFLGIWQGIVIAANFIWKIGSKAVTVAIKATLTALQWAVTNVTRLVVAGLKKTAVFLARVAKTTYRLARRGITAALKAIDKAVDWLKGTLNNFFKPILSWLDRMRGHVMHFYRRYVRPLLDAIDVTRRVFQFLGWLGLDWARAVDRALARVEDIITYPFTWAVAKINEIIGIINRIVTLDGLLQRIVLLRSMARDVYYTNNLFWNSQTRELSGGELEAAQKRHAMKPPDEYDDELRQFLTSESGPLEPILREMVADSVQIARRLRGQL